MLSNQELWQILLVTPPSAQSEWGDEIEFPAPEWTQWAKDEILRLAGIKEPTDMDFALYAARILQLLESVAPWRDGRTQHLWRHHGIDCTFYLQCIRNGLHASGKESDLAEYAYDRALEAEYFHAVRLDKWHPDLPADAGEAVFCRLTYIGTDSVNALSPPPRMQPEKTVEASGASALSAKEDDGVTHSAPSTTLEDNSISRTKRRARGRPAKSNPARDRELAEGWERYRESGMQKAQYAEDQGITSEELERALDRDRKRE